MVAKPYLFAITHWLLTAGAILMLLVTALMALAEGALLVGLFNRDGNHMEIPAVMDGISRNTIFAVAIPVVGALVAGVLVLALIFHLTAKTVETALLSDPFVGQNATRLTQIGWLLLGIEVMSWAM